MGLKSLYNALLYIMIALIPFKIVFEISEIVISPLEIIIYILIYLTIIKYLFRPRRTNMTFLFMFLLFYLLTIPSKLQLLEPKNFVQGIWHITRNVLEPLPLVFLLIPLNFQDKKRIKKAVLILILSMTIASGIGIIQTLSGGRYLTGIGVYGNFRYLGIFPPLPSDSDPLGKEYLGKVSVFTHVPYTDIFRAHGGLTRHNYFGAFLVLGSVITLSLALTGKHLLFLAFLIQSIALAMTFTRAAYVGFTVSLFLLFIFKTAWKRIFNISMAVGMITLFFLYLAPLDINKQLGNRFATIFKPKDAVEMKERLRAYEICLKKIEKKPFFGYGGGGLEGFEINGYRLTSHNDMLEIIYTRGIIAFLIIYFLYLLILKEALMIRKRAKDVFIQKFAAGFFSGFIGIIITGIFQPILMVPDTSALIWLTMGFIVAIKESEHGSMASMLDKKDNSLETRFVPREPNNNGCTIS